MFGVTHKKSHVTFQKWLHNYKEQIKKNLLKINKFWNIVTYGTFSHTWSQLSHVIVLTRENGGIINCHITTSICYTYMYIRNNAILKNAIIGNVLWLFLK